MSGPNTPPRIFCIPATEAPVVAVLRRGPTDWAHVGRWDTASDSYEPGSWFHGRLFPQKCDLSPNGRWLAYSAMKSGADWPGGEIYEAISRLPWLTALAAWEAGTTYTRGIHFDDEAGTSQIGEPDVGDPSPALRLYGVKLYGRNQFAVERRRGWVESEDTPPREAGGHWDEKRRVEMVKAQPGTGNPLGLHVSGRYAGFREMPDYHEPAEYFLTSGGDIHVLDDVQWADWDRAGRLLVATKDGRLQARVLDGFDHEVVFAHDLSGMTPDPQPPPAKATKW